MRGYGGGIMISKSVCRVVLLVVIGLVAVDTPILWAEEYSEARISDIYFKNIAVAPFLVGHRQPNMDESLDDTLSCPINQICVEDPSIAPDAGVMMQKLVYSALKGRYHQQLVSMDKVQSAYTEMRLDGAKDTPRTLTRKMGQSLSADLMLVGTVWRYRDRGAIEGFPDRPSSVAFALYLVEAESGRRLWRGVFDMAQEFALRDMARFSDRIRMGLKWLSADELARHGVKEIFRTFPPNIKPAALKPTDGRNAQ
jgi:hypothetical protein